MNLTTFKIRKCKQYQNNSVCTGIWGGAHSTTDLSIQLVHWFVFVTPSPRWEEAFSCHSIQTCLMVSFFFVFLYDVLWSSCHRMVRLLKDCYRWSHGWKEIRTLGEVTGSLQWQFQTRKEVRWPTGDSWPLSMLCTHIRKVSPYEYGLILTVQILSWDGFQMNVIHLHVPTPPYPRLSGDSVVCLKVTRSALAHLLSELTGPRSRRSHEAAPPALARFAADHFSTQ